MHVLVAAHDLYPDPGSGGTGRYVYETGRRLVDRGHEVSVITRRRGDVPRREAVAGLDVDRYDVSIAETPGTDIATQLPTANAQIRQSVERLSDSGPPDLVSVQGPVTSLFVDRHVPDSIPRVATFHSPWPTEYALRTGGDETPTSLRRRLNVTVRRALEGRLLARCDGIVTLSRYMREQLEDVYGELGQTAAVDGRERTRDGPAVEIVPGGVDTARYTPAAGDYEPMADAQLAFLTVRRLARRMGHGRLLEAFARVRETRPEAHLFVAGDGPLREELERRAVAEGVGDATTFLGYVPDEDLPAAYASADVFVLPTQRLEGFGLATLEALSSATPVVATPVGGTVEILDAFDDRLPVSPLAAGTDDAALEAGMRAWAALDSSTRRTAGKTCRRIAVEEYSWEQSVDGILDAYEDHVTGLS